MKIMIVDDNKQVREMIKSLLTQPEIEFCECSDGTQVEGMYRIHRPDWVLMDVMMTEIDGITATRTLKRSHPEARVLIVTQYDDSTMREEARLAGADGYIAKDNLQEIAWTIGSS